MHKPEDASPIFLLFSFLYLISCFNVGLAGTGEKSGGSSAGVNPFTPKAYLVRYWKKQIANDLPKPEFFLKKVSPLNAVQSASFSKLADQNALSTQLPSFCSAANLLCFPDLSPSLEKHSGDVNFATYSNRNFTNYGTRRSSGVDSFKNYTDGDNIAVDSFRQYSRDSLGHDDSFTGYARDGNVADQTFNTYGTNALGANGDFSHYQDGTNNPNLKFTSYSADASGREQTFSSYTGEANAGDESFANYGKGANGVENEFNNYGKDSNVVGSTFSNYGQKSNAENDTFTSYGTEGNVPENVFKNYAVDANAASENFANYRDQSNVGDDSFQSYGKGSNGPEVNFANYGKSFNQGSDKFTGYGKGAVDPAVDFKIYGVNTTFKDYAKKGVTFSKYNQTALNDQLSSMEDKTGGKKANKWVEPGKFFREKMLKSGTVMPMPDIRDKMPKRSFLPRVILSKLPFSTSKLDELKKIFHAGEDSSMAGMLANSIRECERPPSRDETKRCVGSAEDMIDFATSVLGRNVVVRTTENTQGSKGNVMVGSVKKINGGRVTKSVSCHQSLFPYLLYYCHSVPKVRVYEADLLDPNTKAKMNHGVAICHVDTSSWSAGHGAFAALGSGPGKIEVCHWIFENDMTWAIAD
ncbi:hypothetical protein RJ640_016150 [Escallonia rubra]|uniref:BURP domain-containing protein n=1 Tax=Escallonia rubra TaxID=112253 RepID=A0AA88UD76_9ASTE|nr:hypothetical protein RJ640_016150 [Escallonia rubra]